MDSVWLSSPGCPWSRKCLWEYLQREFGNNFVVDPIWIDAGAYKNLYVSISNLGEGGIKLTVSEYWGAYVMNHSLQRQALTTIESCSGR